MARSKKRQRRAGAVTVRPLTKLPRPIHLSFIEDRRTYHPDRSLRPVRKLSGHPSQKQLVPKKGTKKYLPSSLNFQDSGRIAICVRRRIRKEVMFAKGKAGRRGQKPPRRNFHSKTGC